MKEGDVLLVVSFLNGSFRAVLFRASFLPFHDDELLGWPLARKIKRVGRWRRYCNITLRNGFLHSLVVFFFFFAPHVGKEIRSFNEWWISRTRYIIPSEKPPTIQTSPDSPTTFLSKIIRKEGRKKERRKNKWGGSLLAYIVGGKKN